MLRKGQLWTSVVVVTLVGAWGLEVDSPGDLFVRLRLGDQRHKSKVLGNTRTSKHSEEGTATERSKGTYHTTGCECD